MPTWRRPSAPTWPACSACCHATRCRYVPRVAGVLALDDVWMPLDALEPLAKEALVEAITAAISHDGRIGVAEAELLRTICGVLHCPLPPMLGRAGPHERESAAMLAPRPRPVAANKLAVGPSRSVAALRTK